MWSNNQDPKFLRKTDRRPTVPTDATSRNRIESTTTFHSIPRKSDRTQDINLMNHRRNSSLNRQPGLPPRHVTQHSVPPPVPCRPMYNTKKNSMDHQLPIDSRSPHHRLAGTLGDTSDDYLIVDPSEIIVIDYADGMHAPRVPPMLGVAPLGSKKTRSRLPLHHKSTKFTEHTDDMQRYTSRNRFLYQHHQQQCEVDSSSNQYCFDVNSQMSDFILDKHTDYVPKKNYSLNSASNLSNHSSDTSSAYSGSDTMQSYRSSSLDNDPIDFSGLQESIVDSDEELVSSMEALHFRDHVRECLEKDPTDRSESDIDVLLQFSQSLQAFNNTTLAVRRALCSVMVFAVVKKAGTIVMNDGEELDAWSVIINGQVRTDFLSDNPEEPNVVEFLNCGQSFGITPTMQKMYHKGIMSTTVNDCQFVCITQTDYYKILNDGESNQRQHLDEDGSVVLVTELVEVDTKTGYKVIRGTPERLLHLLIDDDLSHLDANYIEDFLLTHRTFMKSIEVAQQLLAWFNDHSNFLKDKVTRILMLWTNNHFNDFESDSDMMLLLEEFERALECAKMTGQLRMLNFACAAKACCRTITISRSSRDEALPFTLIGGYERGFPIFVDKVFCEPDYDDEDNVAKFTGKTSHNNLGCLRRGDQVLEVNGRSFDIVMTLVRALSLVRESTHLEITVKSNILGYKELFQSPEKSQRARLRKSADVAGWSSKSYSQDDSSLNLASSNSTTLPPPMPASGFVWGNRTDRLRNALLSMLRPSKLSSYPVVETTPTKDENPSLHRSGSMNECSIDTGDVIGNSLDNLTMCDSLKVYNSDQQSRYLLIHKNTTAREVVMLSLQEFGLTEHCSSNFTLCQVTVENGCVRQKRLPDSQQNLSDRIGLSSRYYIKNIMSSEQLIPEDIVSELAKESEVNNLLQLNVAEVSAQLMVQDFGVFRQIEPTELIDSVFKLESIYGVDNLIRFGDLMNKEMLWVITEIVSEPQLSKRVKIIKRFVKMSYHCYKETHNYNSMFAIVSGLDHGAVKRLKNTWDRVPGRSLKLLSEMQSIMDPSMNFRKYRSLINKCRPPMIPIYPIVNKDLTFIHIGNKSKIDDLINFEKLRMIAKEIRNLSSMCSNQSDTCVLPINVSSSTSHFGTLKRSSATSKNAKLINAKKMHEEAQMIRRVRSYLRKMLVESSESITSLEDQEQKLHHLSVECEQTTKDNNLITTFGGNSQQLPHQQHTIFKQPSQSSIGSRGKKRNGSPTPSNASSGSSHSDSIKNCSSKFGTSSPHAVRKLMSLSESSRPTSRRVQTSKNSRSNISSMTGSNNISMKKQNQQLNPLEINEHYFHERNHMNIDETDVENLNLSSTNIPPRLPKRSPQMFAGPTLPQLLQNLPHSTPPPSSSSRQRLFRSLKGNARTNSRDPDDSDCENEEQISAV